ncbi:hypothetical protein ACFQZF_08110 [Flavobacterium myungsuense]|uniref:hypothetical protein n=1 Tax=Flavobacterium myungsuense TaxID=651823 RepID=UPI0036278983
MAHQGRFEFREEPTDFRFWDNDFRADSKDYQNWSKSSEYLSKVMEKTNRSYEEVYKEFLINDAIEHPFWFTRQFFVKCIYGHLYFINSISSEKFVMGPFKGSIGYWIFILIINSINLIIITGAFLFLIKQRNLIDYWIFWSIIIALLIFHGLIYMEPRYLFPSRVALYIMSAAGLYRLRWVKNIINRMAVYLFPLSKNDKF